MKEGLFHLWTLLDANPLCGSASLQMRGFVLSLTASNELKSMTLKRAVVSCIFAAEYFPVFMMKWPQKGGVN